MGPVTAIARAAPGREARRRYTTYFRAGAAVSIVLLIGLIALVRDSGPSRPSARASVQILGRAPTHDRVTLTLLLRLPGATRLHRELEAIENPRSGHFRHFMTAATFGARYGVSTAALKKLKRTLKREGLLIITSFPQRTAVIASGTIESVSRLLRVPIVNYRDTAGHLWHAPLGKPTLPPTLAGVVSGVTGLNTRPKLKPRDVPQGGLTPQNVALAYNIAPLHALGVLGHGLKIAVVAFSDFHPAEPATFVRRYALGGPEPRVIKIAGGGTIDEGTAETNLDIDIVRGVAPAAQVLVYEAPNPTSVATVVNRIVADHLASVVTDSWGNCQLQTDRAEQSGDIKALESAVAAGISVFAASGDEGAYDCQREDLSNHRLSVDWPAASASVVSVGGTRLYLAPDGSYVKEAGWEGALSRSGGGGGVASGVSRPRWQSAPGVRGRARGVPDVSADADPGTGWSAYSSKQFQQAGGTSASTPFWAASTLLIEQYARNHGAGRLGYLNPLLYTLASTRHASGALHDITAGGNRYYQAAPGWDAATGLGSPNVYNLARDITALLKGKRH
jgi:subtilase family serine protease